MKLKSKSLSSQLLIVIMMGLVLALMIQFAQAQSIASSVGATPQAQVLQIQMPQKADKRGLLENTTLNWYQMFLGPTAAGLGNTYNVFQEGQDNPGTGRAPLQSFHVFNLRHQINNDWAISTGVAMTQAYSQEVKTDGPKGQVINKPGSQFFNMRVNFHLPTYAMKRASLFTTVSYEGATSSVSRNQDMLWGWVIQNSLSINTSNPRWAFGVMGQVYRAYYRLNNQPPLYQGFAPTPLQTVIVSGGPYVNYRFNDKWMLGSLVTMDWDQRGRQTETTHFNNNLPHRARATLTYYPSFFKYLTSVGAFAQGLVKFSPATTALGAEFAMRF